MARKKSTPPTVQKLEPSHYSVMPWKNGAGTTQQIAIDDRSPFRWRLSTAQVEKSGPFSLYPTYDRHLVVVDGGTLSLSRQGETRLLPPKEVFSFRGEDEYAAHLLQPCRDLNLFLERNSTHGSLHLARYRGTEEIQFPYQGIEHFVFGIEGSVEYLEPNSDHRGTLEAGQTLRVTRPDGVNLLNLRTRPITPVACVAWVTISYKS